MFPPGASAFLLDDEVVHLCGYPDPLSSPVTPPSRHIDWKMPLNGGEHHLMVTSGVWVDVCAFPTTVTLANDDCLCLAGSYPLFLGSIRTLPTASFCSVPLWT